MSIDAARAEIDRIDQELGRLLDARAGLVRSVAEEKAGAGLATYDPEREAAILAGSHHPAVTAALLRESKAEQVRAAPPAEPLPRVLRPGFTVVAGPCSAEDPRQLDEVGAELVRLGVRCMRAGVWKPRTSHRGFQGHGPPALAWMREACDRHGLELWTEIRDLANIPEAESRVDVAWIGARNGQCFELLRAVGRSFPRVVLKRGAGMTVEEWVAAAGYLQAGGAAVALCERGIRGFDRSFRNTLDLAGAAWARRLSGLEVLVDVSHSTGLPALAAPMAAAAQAAGLDGVMAEAHPRPRESVTDADQALSFAELGAMVRGLR